MSILNYNSTLQSNNTDLQEILDMVNGLPERTNNEDVIIMRTISEYTNYKVKVIGRHAFYCYTKLTSISFPACTSISAYAFYGCSNLTSISFPVCTSIGEHAFQFCRSLTSVYFPACTVIGEHPFSDAYNFMAATFCDCFYLTSANFPVCSHIGEAAFANCPRLTSISFPACRIIASGAFDGCTSLTSVSFPVCSLIYSSVFSKCVNLSNFYLGNSSVCTLTNSTTFTSTPYAGYSAYFSGTPYIYVPSSLVDAYKTATNWTYFSSYISAIEDAPTV